MESSSYSIRLAPLILGNKTRENMLKRSSCSLIIFSSVVAFACHQADAQGLVVPERGDKVVILGNTLAERMQYFNHFETLLHSRFADQELVVRNLGWSADAIDVRLRSQDFPDHGHTLIDHQPNLILAMFGYNESFAGKAGLPAFEKKLGQFVDELKQLKYPSQTYKRGSYEPALQDKQGVPQHDVQVVLISPIACEDIPEKGITAGTDNNPNLALYTAAMGRVAKAKGIPFVDLFTQTKQLQNRFAVKTYLTMNGVHLNDKGYRHLATILDQLLFGDGSGTSKQGDNYEELRTEIAEKNLQFFYDYRAVNGFYIYGGRKEPFGVVNFPAEFEKLRKMIAVRDQRVWDVAQGVEVSQQIDDSETGDFSEIQTNFKNEVYVTPPNEAAESFTLQEGFEISLWASEVDFPNLENPVQFTFDGKGRLYVTTMPSYPMYLPGEPVDDKVLILADSDRDGRADKETIFARGLHVPTGIELANGGAFVAQQPNMMFLKDTDGDDVADEYQLRLHGFDSADSHHSISAFELGPGGALYFQEGTFHHSQIETSQGPRRVANAAVFRYEPRSEKLDIFVSYDFAKFLHVKYMGTKRFGLDGGEALIPAMEQIIKRGGALGVQDIVIGMPHRGRLNILANVMQKPYRAIFNEFQGGSFKPEDVDGSGDVKYHLGASSDREFDGNNVHLSLTANPSHLEAVNPVVLGKVRAKQDQIKDEDRSKVMPILLHGDAAFAGQGVVAECFALSGLRGHKAGGTVHIVVNNQIGFTTAPHFSRSSPYPTDNALVVEAPIFHVNGDDPEAVVHAAKVATEFRQKFHKDVVIDIFCYRRFGHNEGDEPMFTNPMMYKKIKGHKTTLTLYTDRLVKDGLIPEGEIEDMKAAFQAKMNEEFEAGKEFKPNKADWLDGKWSHLDKQDEDYQRGATAIKPETFDEVGRGLTTLPEGYPVHKTIGRFLETRKKMFETGEGIDWATGEALAFGSLC